MPISQSECWDAALEDLRTQLDEQSFSTWIEPVQFVGHEDGVVTLRVASRFYRNMLANHFEDRLQEALRVALHRDVRIEYEISGDGPPDEATLAPEDDTAVGFSNTEQRAMEFFRTTPRHGAPGELINVPLNRKYSFDNFVVGESNRFAHAAALAVADPNTRVYNPLFIYGGVGLGKTHLMQAIGQKMISAGEHLNVLYVSSEAFMNAFIEAVAQKRMVEFRNCFRNVDLLMVDDVQFFAGAESTQTEFFHTFNVLFDAGKKIVISSDHPPKELNELEERLRSRFEWGLIVDIQAPDLETRVAILRKKARAMGMDIPPEVTIFIAERIRSNLRKLEGALTRLSAHSAMNGHRPISMDMARQLLGPFLMGDEPRKITIEKVQIAVCSSFNISLQELTGANRSRKYSGPRQIAAYLCRELTDCSFPEIARQFGGRDHSSIIHSHRKVQKDMATNLGLQNLIKHLTREIKDDRSASFHNGQ